MLILGFVDMHGSVTALEKIKEKSKKADILVGCGDFTVFEQSLDYILSELNKLGKDVLVIHGNHETEETMEIACKPYNNIHFIHGKHFIKDDIIFFGWGGGGFSNVDKDFDKQKKKFTKLLEENPTKPGVLITHAPPYKTKLDYIGKSNNGNKSFSDFIRKNRVSLVLCGHFHENNGAIDKINKTTIINPGPHGSLINL
jgi:Icc-related predicted phosphoesterase